MNTTSMNMQGPEPLVSVVVPTYQHASYIGQCLDGILMQRTDFPYEILVGEDESSDGTREICQHYADQHHGIIRLFLRERKDVLYIGGKPTGRTNLLKLLGEARGKYIAFCEGDDYWTDPLKLQKQIDHLESHPGLGLCAHCVLESNAFDHALDRSFPAIDKDTEYDLEDFIQYNRVATCSMMFRREAFFPIPDFMQRVPYSDRAISLTVMHRTNGKAMVLKDEMGVYRLHAGGVHGSLRRSPELLGQAYQQHIDFMRIMERELFIDGSHAAPINLVIANFERAILSLKDRDQRPSSRFYILARQVLAKLLRLLR